MANGSWLSACYVRIALSRVMADHNAAHLLRRSRCCCLALSRVPTDGSIRCLVRRHHPTLIPPPKTVPWAASATACIPASRCDLARAHGIAGDRTAPSWRHRWPWVGGFGDVAVWVSVRTRSSPPPARARGDPAAPNSGCHGPSGSRQNPKAVFGRASTWLPLAARRTLRFQLPPHRAASAIGSSSSAPSGVDRYAHACSCSLSPLRVCPPSVCPFAGHLTRLLRVYALAAQGVRRWLEP